MFYKGHDRMPVIHWAGWNETRERWIKEGMPADIYEHVYFQAVPFMYTIFPAFGLYPEFEREIIEETGEYTVSREADGVVQKAWKHASNIPHYIDFTLKSAREWYLYKKKLQPDPARIPANVDELIATAENSGFALRFDVTSLMGGIRNWMGVENMCYLMYDDRDVFADMVNTLADLTCWGMDQIVPRMKSKPDIGFGWEDICGKSGPFVSPEIFDKCVAPGYTKIRNKLESYGVHLLGVDSDGDISALAGHWLDAGVNVLFPIEIGTWNADPMEYRRRYGKELRMIGGFNKLVLEKSHKEIDEEIEKRIPLMKEGGFLVMPDHVIPPGVSLENYKYYINRIRNLRF